MVDPIKLPIPAPPPTADAHARADTERNRRLFDWAEAVLKSLGLDKAVATARSIEELRRIMLDVNSAEIALALRDALHPASGQRQEHFRGLKEGSLKLILKNRFAELKKTREQTLKQGGQPVWTDELMLDKDGKPVPNLSNLILILEAAPKWQGVLGYNGFAAHVVIRRRPPWGKEPPDAPWVDHHESLARVWFQKDAGINPSAGDLGRAVQAAARGYLRDSTGARRLWPVACRGMIDLAGLEKMRDQLWAEAVHRFKAGEPWWLETPEFEALATAEQEARFVADAWEAPIVEWLENRIDTSVGEVLKQVFGLAKEQQSQSAQNRVARILAHRLGFTKVRPRTPEGRRENRYRRELSAAKS